MIKAIEPDIDIIDGELIRPPEKLEAKKNTLEQSILTSIKESQKIYLWQKK
jgi:hypothetical protein